MRIRLFKAGIILALVIGTVVSSAQAYFTSNVVAADNEVSTGTLALEIDSIDPDNLAAGYFSVARDVDGVSTSDSTLTPWESAIPGENHHYWIAFRNIGTMPFSYTYQLGGTWGELRPECVVDPTLITTTSTRVDGLGCDSNSACQGLKTSLESESLSESSTEGHLEVGEFSIYQVTLSLSEETDNCYQNASYYFEIEGTAEQIR